MKTSFDGPPIDDAAILARLPSDISDYLKRQNGFISANGGFHVRGACIDPAWHSLRAAWEGEFALNSLFPEVHDSDVPLAEDCFGDQFLLRDCLVIRLLAETGEIEETDCDWPELLKKVEADPIGFLNLKLLERFQEETGPLVSGFHLSLYPPLIARECDAPLLKAISALGLRAWHSDLAKQIKSSRWTENPNKSSVAIRRRTALEIV